MIDSGGSYRGHTGGKDKRCRGNTWFIPYDTIQSRLKERPHPATFPKQLPLNCLLIHGVEPRSVVLDPFVGIGTTGLAAAEVGIKNFLGFDLDGDYLATAEKMLAEEAGIEATIVKRASPSREIKSVI